MDKEEVNQKAKKIYEEWNKKREQVEKEAKDNGIWNYIGLDSNRHLFKEVDDEAKQKLKALSEQIEE